MVARSQFRHDTPVFGVDFDLAVERMRHQASFGVVNGHAGFIAGGFDTEYVHGLI
jgi:hypothetical protein